MKQELKMIGKIHSELKRKEDCPLQENENAPEAMIEIFHEFLEGIKDIKAGSEILLLTCCIRPTEVSLNACHEIIMILL